MALDEIARRKIDRYLDVTKSAFLFGGRILLVEGIAEALLLPILAKDYVFKHELEKYRLFRSAVFVPIDSVDFEPYVRLLLTPYEGVRIADRVVVITDGDSAGAIPGKAFPGQLRKTKLEEIAANFGAASVFDVVINTYSLESELVAAGNADVLKRVYLALHPNSEAKWDRAVGQIDAEQAVAIQDLFKSTRKGDFAQLLAEEIGKGAAFKVPGYINALLNHFLGTEELVWTGDVEVFTLSGHPQTREAFAWNYKTDDGRLHSAAVLKVPPIETPSDAVRAAIASGKIQ